MIAFNLSLVLLSAVASITSAAAIDDPIIPALIPSAIGDGASNIGDIILPAPGICGISQGIRIKGDIKTPINAFPWTAQIIIRPIKGGEARIICGGSLISDQIILTAAQCIREIQEIPIDTHIASIRLGAYDIIGEQQCIDGKKCADKPIEIEIESSIIHKDYDGSQIHNDIAIIKIARKVIFTEYISPICLPNPDAIRLESDNGKILTIIGWGIAEIGQKQSGIIGNRYKQAIDIIGIDQEICREKIPIIQDSEICAVIEGGIEGGIDSCIGDIGGSLVATGEDGIWYQYGIIINDKKCGEIGITSIYTRIISFIDWIKIHIN